VQFSKVRVAYLTGTHKGAFGDLQSTGKKFKVNGMTEFSFSNAKIVERSNLVGMVSLKEQLTG
jgi:predicted ester cyclase